MLAPNEGVKLEAKMTEDEKLSAAIWREGLHQLADEIKEHGPELTMITEMLDRLLLETGNYQDSSEMTKFLKTEGIEECDADFVGTAYEIVDMVRTGTIPIKVYPWSDDEMERIREKAEATL